MRWDKAMVSLNVVTLGVAIIEILQMKGVSSCVRLGI